MNLAIVQEIRTTNTPNGHGRTLYRVTTHHGGAWGSSPIPTGPHEGARHAETFTSYHLDHYGDRGYSLHDPSQWLVCEPPALHVRPSDWRKLARNADTQPRTILPDGARQ